MSFNQIRNIIDKLEAKDDDTTTGQLAWAWYGFQIRATRYALSLLSARNTESWPWRTLSQYSVWLLCQNINSEQFKIGTQGPTIFDSLN